MTRALRRTGASGRNVGKISFLAIKLSTREQSATFHDHGSNWEFNWMTSMHIMPCPHCMREWGQIDNLSLMGMVFSYWYLADIHAWLCIMHIPNKRRGNDHKQHKPWLLTDSSAVSSSTCEAICEHWFYKILIMRQVIFAILLVTASTGQSIHTAHHTIGACTLVWTANNFYVWTHPYVHACWDLPHM